MGFFGKCKFDIFSLLVAFNKVRTRVELLTGFKFTGKMVKKIKFTGKIGKNGKQW